MSASDGSIAEKVRCRIEAGGLPSEHQLEMSAVRGDSEMCSTCDRIIQAAEAMSQIEWNRQIYRFHIVCYSVWKGELMLRQWRRPE